MAEETIIQLSNLTKDYGKLRAVDQLSLDIKKGEIFGLLGPNGAGKTTTILMMLGLTDPTSGSVTVCGVDATTNPIAVKQKVGYMPDSVGFYDNMTAIENLMYIGRLNGIADEQIRERAEQIMDMVGLADRMDKKTATYSRGMKQRLGLADVLIREPEVIIMDEPTLGIDPSGIKDFLTLIHSLSKEMGLTVLLSSHQLHQVQQVCDRVGIFVDGKLLVQGSIDSLAHQLFGEETFVVQIELTDDPHTVSSRLDELRSSDKVKKVVFEHKILEVSSDVDITPDLVKYCVEQGWSVTSVNKKKFGLDEIYHKYFEEGTDKGVRAIKSKGFRSGQLFKK